MAYKDLSPEEKAKRNKQSENAKKRYSFTILTKSEGERYEKILEINNCANPSQLAKKLCRGERIVNPFEN